MIDPRFYNSPFTLSDRERVEFEAMKPEARDYFLSIAAHTHLYRAMEQAKAPSVTGGYLLSPWEDGWLVRHFEEYREEYIAAAWAVLGELV